MKNVSYPQFAIVKGDSAQDLEERLNVRLRKLRMNRPEVTFEGFIAHISYIESEWINESLSDEYSSVGVELHCQDCPFFEPKMKRDGTEDRRARNGGCRFAEYHATARDARACDRLFEMLNRGEVRLCLAE